MVNELNEFVLATPKWAKSMLVCLLILFVCFLVVYLILLSTPMFVATVLFGLLWACVHVAMYDP